MPKPATAKTSEASACTGPGLWSPRAPRQPSRHGSVGLEPRPVARGLSLACRRARPAAGRRADRRHALRPQRGRAHVPVPLPPRDGGVADRDRRDADTADAGVRARAAPRRRRLLPRRPRGRAPGARAGGGADAVGDPPARGDRVHRQRQGRRAPAGEDISRRGRSRLLGGRGASRAGGSGMSDINLYGVATEAVDGRPAGYEISRVWVGGLVGASALGLSVYDLPPGQSPFPYHYQLGRAEWLLGLAGRPTLPDPDGGEELAPGGLVGFPAGEEGAHKVTNNTAETVRIAMISNTEEPSVAFY